MAAEVKLPRLGQGMESGTIVKWLKAEGERVGKGEPLYEVDTEKATQEVEAEVDGVLLRIAVPEGEVPVGETIAFIGEPGEKVEIEAPSADGKAAAPEREAEPAEKPEPEDAPEQAPEAEQVQGAAEIVRDARERIKASPLARRMARERGVELSALTGTGPEGRIVAEDVEGVVRAPAEAPAPVSAAAPEEVEQVALTSVRKTIARRLTEAWRVPVFQLQVSADMTRANELLARLRERDSDLRITVTDLLTKVTASALMRHREVNVQFTDEALLTFPSANVGLAVAAPQGLVVPVIKGAERLSLDEIARARADLVGRARERKLHQDDLEEGTFTISNLGMYGIERFTAVLNPPQAAIVAVGAIEDRVMPEGVRPMMTLSATFDHRAVDGAPAAEFLQDVKELLEEPGLML